MTGNLAIGAHTGWYLDFRDGPAETASRTKSFGSTDYVASIDAALPGGLDGGSYTFVIEGVSSEDYRELYTTMSAGTLVVRLHLYWRDAGGVKGYFVDLTGLSDTFGGDEPPKASLVSVLRVTSLSRRPGARRYEVVVQAREWVFDRVLGRLASEGSETDLLAAVKAIAKDSNIGVTAVIAGEIAKTDSNSTEHDRSWEKRQVAVDRLRDLERAIEFAKNMHGLGMLLIRDGTLYGGPGRLKQSHVTLHDELTDDTGLVEIIAQGHEVSDPYFVSDDPNAIEPRRAVYELVLRGRPDIKPGDFVELKRPAEETDSSGTPNRFSLDLVDEVKAGAPIRLYVRGVMHSLSRERAFVTTLRGVSVPIDDDRDTAWFRWSVAKSSTRIVATQAASDGTPDGEFIGALRDVVDNAGGRRIDVAQVRATNVKDTKLANQTEKLWRGLMPYDSRKYGASVMPFDTENKSSFDDAPYITPFAWGKFGLMLPRYPGMRVVVGHRLGDPDDVLDLGATWTRGEAPTCEPGDYWLSLPAAIAVADREKVADSENAKAPAGKASNDLVDADGNRVIEVGKLTIRVGTDLLKDAGKRPVIEDAHVHIEHKSGAKIVIDQDGNITIKAAGKLDFVAGGQITFDTPDNVIVKTDGFMDVKGRS